MGRFHYNKKGYPTWNDSGKTVHSTVLKVPAGHVVHHKDGNEGNFRHENLQDKTRSSHSKYHAKQRSSWY